MTQQPTFTITLRHVVSPIRGLFKMVRKRDRNIIPKKEEREPPPPPTWKQRWLTPNIIVTVVLFLLATAGTIFTLTWGVFSENWDNRIINKFKASDEFKKIAAIETAVNATNNTLAGMNERLKALERTAFPKEIKAAQNAGVKDPQLNWVPTSGPSQFASTYVYERQQLRVDVTFHIDQAEGDAITIRAIPKLFRGSTLLAESEQKPTVTIPAGKSEILVIALTPHGQSKPTIQTEIRMVNMGRSQGKWLVATGQSGVSAGG